MTLYDLDPIFEGLATKMADANFVEEAWFLRGVWDALQEEHDDLVAVDEDYGVHYRKGFSVTVAWDQGVL